MSDTFEEKETYLFLDFESKVDFEDNRFAKPFLRIADLNTPNPLVQFNDLIYKGNYDDCVGTNLFFTEEENTTSATDACFKKETSLSLRFLLSQNKVLHLKCVKPKSNQKNTCENTNVDINLNQDYNTTLKKLATGNLNMEDLVPKNEEEIVKADFEREAIAINPVERNRIESSEAAEKCNKKTNDNAMDTVEEGNLDNSELIDTTYRNPTNLEKNLDVIALPEKSTNLILLEKYEKLQKLSRRPVHRDIEPELVQDCEEKYKLPFTYHNVERQIFQRSDSFPFVNFDIDNNTLKNVIDTDRCILYNLIKSSNKGCRILGEEEKMHLLRLENFEFLSQPARYAILKQEVEYLETYIENADKSKLKEVDEFGRTPVDTLHILKKLVNNLGIHLNSLKIDDNLITDVVQSSD